MLLRQRLRTQNLLCISRVKQNIRRSANAERRLLVHRGIAQHALLPRKSHQFIQQIFQHKTSKVMLQPQHRQSGPSELTQISSALPREEIAFQQKCSHTADFDVPSDIKIGRDKLREARASGGTAA